MKFAVNEKSPIPLYRQITNVIRAAVDSGSLPEGSLLEPEPRLAKELRVSIPTIRKAMDLLEAEGIITRKRGRGTFVTARVRTRPLTLVPKETAESAPEQDTDLAEINPDDDVRKELQLCDGARIWRLRRMHKLAGSPAALLDDYIPTRPTPHDLDSARHLGPGQVLPALSAKTRLTRHHISAQTADDELSSLLHIAEGTAVITVERTAYNPSGVPVSFSRHTILAALYTLETTF